MTKESTIVRYTTREIAEMIARGEDASDVARALAKSDDQLAAETADDAAWDGIDDIWLQNADVQRGPSDKIKASKP